MNNSERRPAEQRYYEKLAQFTSLCEQLLQSGAPYFAIVLCHELYRFLYPVEPYAHFENRHDPVSDALTRIEKLIELGVQFTQSVRPYQLPPAASDGGWRTGPLETATSNLYSELWNEFDRHTLVEEAVDLLRARLPDDVISQYVAGRNVLDMGCGSGRYTLALARLGAARATGIDFQSKSFHAAQAWAREHGVQADFKEGNVLELPFANRSFDFVFCNGVIHHSASISQGLSEIARVLKPEGRAFLYLYAAGGVFWTTRRALRAVFAQIPLAYTQAMLHMMGMPSNRFIFCDTWYVPVETHTTTAELAALLDAAGFEASKLPGKNAFDLDGAIEGDQIPGAREMWGDGEHRCLLTPRKASSQPHA